MTTVPVSILDLASIGAGESLRESLEGCVQLAQAAERLGYTRVWYAEHHNSETIASSAPAVLIAHVAANTSTIRLGSGGVMLPNHSPLVIAEQFGMLATLHPGRIDLGLGRAPGTDQTTVKALRRDPRAAETFAQDVQELQGERRIGYGCAVGAVFVDHDGGGCTCRAHRCVVDSGDGGVQRHRARAEGRAAAVG